MEQVVHRVDWENLWSVEAKKKQLPSLHGIVSRYTKEPDVIGMHGGLPPSNTFPFTSFHCGLLPLEDQSDSKPPAAAGDAASAEQHQNVLAIEDPHVVAAAQQYNMQAHGYPPLVAWARDMVVSLHKPATLQPQEQQQQPEEPLQYEPVGMDVVITPGASAALDSLVRVLVNPGDPVLVEEYTYAHMAEAHLLPLGCELVPVSLDAGGLVPDSLDALLTARQAAGQPMPKLLYTIPTGQNPTGSVMSTERMGQIYNLARKWSLIIIEDDAYYWLQYPDGPDIVPGLNLRPGFLSLDVDGRVVRVDTLAKLLGPGFRLGWLSGPPALVGKLGLYMAGISIGANMVSQVMLHELLAKQWGRSGFEAFIKRLQLQYARQAAVAVAAAEQQLAGLAEWRPACAGMFMWFKLTGDLDSETLIEAAAANKVMVVPGHLISVKHLQAAHRRKQLPQQQQQQQGVPDASASQLVDQLQNLTLALQQQQQGVGGEEGGKDGSSGGVAHIAAQLAAISQQLQKLQQLGNSSSSSSNGGSCSPPTPLPAGLDVNKDVDPASPPAAAPVTPPSQAPAAAAAAAVPTLAVTPTATSAAAVDTDHMPCPYFRVSFVSVPAECIQEGFLRLRAAILSCHGPKTPPGEETELASCSSSIGVQGCGMAAAAATASVGDSAMC